MMDTKEITKATIDTELQLPAKIRLPVLDSRMSPSLFQAYCVEKTPTQQTAAASKALAVTVRPMKGSFPTDNDAASRIEQTVSAVVAEHATTPRRER